MNDNHKKPTEKKALSIFLDVFNGIDYEWLLENDIEIDKKYQKFKNKPSDEFLTELFNNDDIFFCNTNIDWEEGFWILEENDLCETEDYDEPVYIAQGEVYGWAGTVWYFLYTKTKIHTFSESRPNGTGIELESSENF